MDENIGDLESSPKSDDNRQINFNAGSDSNMIDEKQGSKVN